MSARRVTLVVLVLAAAGIAVLAGIGTADSFAHDGDLWGGPDTVAVEVAPCGVGPTGSVSLACSRAERFRR